MNPSTFRHAFILAGGLGTRLRSVVKDIPKPMAPVGGAPFLAYLLRYWTRQGVSRFTLSIGYLGKTIRDYFGSVFSGAAIDYVEEMEPLGTGGALSNALNHGVFDDRPVVLLNGDTWFEGSLPQLVSDHERHGCLMTVALRKISKNTRYGGVALTADARISFFGDPTSSLINAGCSLFSPRELEPYLQNLPRKFSLENDLLPLLAKEGRLGASLQHVNFIDIGIPEDYARFCAEKLWSS